MNLKRMLNIHLFPGTIRTLPCSSIISSSQERHVLGSLAVRIIHMVTLVHWNAMMFDGATGFGSHNNFAGYHLSCVLKCGHYKIIVELVQCNYFNPYKILKFHWTEFFYWYKYINGNIICKKVRAVFASS